MMYSPVEALTATPLAKWARRLRDQLMRDGSVALGLSARNALTVASLGFVTPFFAQNFSNGVMSEL
ncbi:Uncharacterised protein [Mycobacteroides abscessus subsp. massiliense]|nr:Uncharacterised protein [Mycobacteroides abscessus subsp. massiliense]